MTETTTTETPRLVGGFFIRWNAETQLWDAGRGDRIWADDDTLAGIAAAVREWIIDEALCPDCADEGTETTTIDGREYGYDSVICPVNECRWMVSDED